jgi:hypothetical protein
MTISFVISGTGCTPQQRVTLTDPMVYGRSPDELHVAWAQQAADGKAVLAVDGQVRSKEYDEIGMIIFSPDNQRVAYSVKNRGKWRVVINDEEPGPAFDEITIIDIDFSPDGKRLAYSARRDNKWYAVVDGKAIISSGHDLIHNLTFSPDSRHFAYSASQDDKQACVIDGVTGPLFDTANKPVWSPDGNRFAYIAEEKGQKSIVLNGREGPKYDDITSPVFSFDSRHFAYGARKDGKSLVVTDGKEGPSFAMSSPIDAIKFAPADDRLGYVANKGDTGGWVVVIDGKAVSVYAYIIGTTLTFNPNGKGFAYVATADRNGVMVVDENRPGPVFDGILGPVYSPDGKHIAYAAKKANRLSLFLDGQAGPELEYSDISDLSYSADGKHLMYRATAKDFRFVVLDGQISPAYDQIYRPAFTTKGVEYLAERESDGCMWRGLIPYAPENNDMNSATGVKVMETKVGWLPTKESMTHKCALCEKQKELLKEQSEKAQKQ